MRPDALVANVDALSRVLPHQSLPLETLCEWAVEWIRADGRLLNKPNTWGDMIACAEHLIAAGVVDQVPPLDGLFDASLVAEPRP